MDSPFPFPYSDPLIIDGRQFNSRLFTGTGKYPSMESMQQSIERSGCDMVTVAVRRVQTVAAGHEGLMEAIDWQRIWMLPNTAGCTDAEEAVRVARLGRELAKLAGQEDNTFVKLEVIPDSRHLLPDPIGTLNAAEQLVREGFTVLPYINADPLLAKRLEEVGCATVMPLGSPIGSGQGLNNAANIGLIIENAEVPVVVDAGIGVPSEAAQALEMGADAVLVNSAIALAGDPAAMAEAMGQAVMAGRTAHLSGRLPRRDQASASSPTTGLVQSPPMK
ncbi:thiazole synthase [Synechococcus sp. MU1643]|uniref:thiazole synthase n=1 Tax=Synechococcus sp. MU1643 TaxID=2508349 RepID=UPI001CF8F040|nr:thiazole synthase [Synechococcus sp. MU1643]MCB4428025.1 thiazole synthase [Synechococcus sp. MU1643]